MFRVQSPNSLPLDFDPASEVLESTLADGTDGTGAAECACDDSQEASMAPEPAEASGASPSSPVQQKTPKSNNIRFSQTASSPRRVPAPDNDAAKSPTSPAVTSSAAASPLSRLSDVSTAVTAEVTGSTPAIATPKGTKPNVLPNNHQAVHGQNWAGQRSPRTMFPGPIQTGQGRLPHGYPPFRPLHTPHLPYAHLSPVAQGSRIEPRVPSGYDLVARKLAAEGPGISLPPLYRRFKTLNHRLLLGIQDELCYLEELLSKQDAHDAQSRTYLEGTVPASRRQESFEPNEITAQRQATLETIAFKLTQYSTFLSAPTGIVVAQLTVRCARLVIDNVQVDDGVQRRYRRRYS